MNTTQLNISRTLIDLKVVREFQRSVVEVIAEESVLAPLAVGGVTYRLARKALTPHSAHSRGHKRYLGNFSISPGTACVLVWRMTATMVV